MSDVNGDKVEEMNSKNVENGRKWLLALALLGKKEKGQVYLDSTGKKLMLRVLPKGTSVYFR